MATKATIVADARNRLRDFPRFFQVSFSPGGRSYTLNKPNIDEESLWVAYVPDTPGASVAVAYTASDYAVDARSGIIRFPSIPAVSSLLVEGYHYDWLLPTDLEFAADLAINELSHNIGTPLGSLAPAVADIYSLRTIVEALWTLLNEYARDIDVITSESVHITASQRYRMVSDLLKHWEDEYNKKAAALNIGLNRIEVFTLRRVSKTTNRLVPIYKPREVGDYAPIERLFPEIDDGITTLEEGSDDLREDVLVDGDPPPGYLNTGYY